MRKISKKLLAGLLVAVMILSLLPVGSVAFNPQSASEVLSGSFTAPDGSEYAVLYNDYLTLYVNTGDGSFAVLPSVEEFDGTKPLSHAAFRINGETYRYGTYYGGITGDISIAPQVGENNILESHWQIGDFVISQIFAITADTAHDNSYAVKIGYAAQYFGDGSADIAGRILLDTQFTPDESVPVMVVDSLSNFALVESEIELRPAPSTAFISKEYIDEANAEAGTPVYTDSPNKGYILLNDNTFASPSALVFAEFNEARTADFSYTPNAGSKLFDGSGADSAALLYWDEVTVDLDILATFGTNYGFYDLEKGNPVFDPLDAPVAFALTAAGLQSATVNFYSTAPEQWFELNTSVATTVKKDSLFGTSYQSGVVSDSGELTIALNFKADTPQVIQDAVQNINIIARWSWNGNDTTIAGSSSFVAAGETYTLDLGEAFESYEDGAELNFAINIWSTTVPEGYSELKVRYSATGKDAVSEEAVVSIFGGNENDVALYDITYESVYGEDRDLYTYYVRHNSTLTLALETSDRDIQPDSAPNLHSYVWGDEVSSGIIVGDLEPLAALAGEATGPFIFDYEFIVPESKYGTFWLYMVDNGPFGANPINVKAFDADGWDASTESLLRNKLSAGGGTGVTREQGLIWAAADTVIEITDFALGAGDIMVYKAGTTEPFPIETKDGVNHTFVMPNEPVDLVYQSVTFHRVFTKVTNEGTGIGTATVTVNSENGSSPKENDDVSIYITNIADGYKVKEVTAVGGAALTKQPGGSYTFEMPDNDVTVTVELEADTIAGNELYDVFVKPLVGDGMKLYDVMFWTDGGAYLERLPNQVDDSGLSGRVRKGATVYYALYPTNWNTVSGSVGDMNSWVVDSFTIDGATPTGFEGINTVAHTGIDYFPYDYAPDKTAAAGSFEMPDNDVTIEIGGYKKEHTYTMSLEAYDQYGNRLDWAEKNIRSSQASNETIEWYETPDGDKVSSVQGIGQFPLDKQTAVRIQRSIYDYTLIEDGDDAVAMYVYNDGVEARIPPVKTERNGNFVTYFFDPVYPQSGTIRVNYKNTAKALTITGFPMDGDNYIGPGEVMVAPGDSFGMAGSDTRRIEVLPIADVFETLVTLTWTNEARGKTHSTIYSLPDSGTGFTSTLEREGSGFAVYKVELTADATVKLQSKNVSRDISFSDFFSANSPNSAKFKTVTLSSGKIMRGILNNDGSTSSLWDDASIQSILTATAAPKITKISLTGEDSTGNVYSKTVSAATNLFTDAASKSAFTFPQIADSNAYPAGSTGHLMELDLRALFSEDENYSFLDGSYTLSIEYSYGENDALKGQKQYTFELSSTSFAPGELTHIAIVKATNTGNSKNWPRESETNEIARKWIAVPGLDYNDMAEQALKYNKNGHLLYLVCESGFQADAIGGLDSYDGEHQFLAMNSEVLLNGHGRYQVCGNNTGYVLIDETADGLTIASNAMSFYSSVMPLFIPTKTGGGNFGSRTLLLRLDNTKNYTIPSALPDYDEIRKNQATNADAVKAWEKEVTKLKDTMLIMQVDYPVDMWAADADFLNAKLNSSGIEVKIGDFKGGITFDTNDIYVLAGGFEVGGRLNIQMPGTSKPVLRLEVLSLSTNSSAGEFPVADLWAEGEGRIQLPSALGGYGGNAYGIFNTYTDVYGFEGEVNFYFIELSGAFYMAKASYGMPVIDSFEVSFGVNDLPIGLGIPPAPAQILEIEGITAGMSNLADFFGHDVTKNTIPSARITLGAQFALVEIIGFEAEMWAEMLSGGISISGGLSVGPIGVDLFKELSFSFGAKDGPYTPDAAVYLKGKRSLTFFVNAKFHASLFFADGAGAFGINMNISPALWEKRDGFESLDEVIKFIDFGITAWGWMSLSVLQMSDDWSLYEAEISLDISFKPGSDAAVMPLGFEKFVFIAKEKYLGIDVGHSRLDVLTYWGALENWIKERVEEQRDRLEKEQGGALSDAKIAQLQLMLMKQVMSSPTTYGFDVDPDYRGEYTSFLDNVVASSETRDRSASARTMRGAAAATGVRVENDGKNFTHHVTVPDSGDYILKLTGYGSNVLDFSDVRVFKPNGQALTIRGASGGMTAAQAEVGYNAVIVDDALLLSLADFLNGATDITGVGDTLGGEWQVVSEKPFRSELISVNNNRRVASVTLSGKTLTATFENINDTDYYYDLTLERKGKADTEPVEATTLLKNMPVSAANPTVKLDLTSLPNIAEPTNASLKHDVADILASGEWYPRITLRQGTLTSYTMTGKDGNEDTEELLTTSFVDDKICQTAYTVKNTIMTGVTWNTPGLTAQSGGNQSIDVSFNTAQNVPDRMNVSGYHVTVYEGSAPQAGDVDDSVIASRIITETDETGTGVQKVVPMEFDIMASGKASYSYNIPNVPVGTYHVGVSPLYVAHDASNPTVAEMDVPRRGTEVMSDSVTVAEAVLPSISLSVSGGNLAEQNGASVIFAGTNATLTAATGEGSKVTICSYDGTKIEDSGTLDDLADFSGQTLMINAKTTATDDSANMFVTVYAAEAAPILLPDNFDKTKGEFVFTAYKDTGGYSITGQTEPGAVIGGVIAGEDGRFSIDGALPTGTDSAAVTLSVANAAGAVTMREVSIVRGDQLAPVTPGPAPDIGTTYYTVTFNTNGGSTVQSQSVARDNTVTRPADPTRDGYTFAGWYSDKELSVAYDFGRSITGDVTIYAKWTEKPTASEPIEWVNPFVDVDTNAWYYDDVGYAYINGLMSGTSEEPMLFSPDTALSRGMIVTILYRMAQSPGASGQSNPFSDVAEGEWYTDAVKWAVESGIAYGYGDGNFGPDDNITRQDLAVMLVRYANFVGIELPELREYQEFNDNADVSDYAKDATSKCYRAKIINGKSGNIFDPKGEATRAEAAAMLRRFLEAVS